jgi:UDP-2,3-diacylglucosamine hydrolase
VTASPDLASGASALRRAAVPDAREVPPMAPPVVVAGDVHLTPERPDVTHRFSEFLDARAGKGGTLFLLGDVFDYWVGPEQAREALGTTVVGRLVSLAAGGTQVLFVGGNRDFAFCRFGGGGGIGLVPDDLVRTRWGTKTVLLTHGDLLCSADPRYQRMRGFLRSRLALGLLDRLPYRVASYLARGLRDLSEREVRRKPYASMGIDYSLARRWLEELDADLLVAGHVHTGVHHRLADGSGAAGGRPRDVIVVKDWDRGGGVVRWDGARVELVRPEDA